MLTDKLGKNADALRRKKLFLLDMDGTIYNEDKIFDGTLAFLSRIEENGGRYIFITNNSSKSVSDYVDKVNGMGIRADASHFFTSSQATAFYLNENYPGQTVFCMGTHSLVDELRENGIPVVTKPGRFCRNRFDRLRHRKYFRKGTRHLHHARQRRDVSCHQSRPRLSGQLRLYPGLRFHEYHAQKRYRKNTVFYRETGAYHDRLRPEKTRRFQRRRSHCGGAGSTRTLQPEKNAGVDTICVLSGEATLDDILKRPS